MALFIIRRRDQEALAKATSLKQVTVPGYTRKDGTYVPPHQKMVHYNPDSEVADIVAGKGSHAQKKAHKKLSKKPGFKDLPVDEQFAHILSSATNIQSKASQAAALSGWKKAAMAGKNPSNAQWAAYYALKPTDKDLTMQQVMAAVGSLDHLKAPALPVGPGSKKYQELVEAEKQAESAGSEYKFSQVGTLKNEGPVIKVDASIPAVEKLLGIPPGGLEAFSNFGSTTYTVKSPKGETFSIYNHKGLLTVRTSGFNNNHQSAKDFAAFLELHAASPSSPVAPNVASKAAAPKDKKAALIARSKNSLHTLSSEGKLVMVAIKSPAGGYIRVFGIADGDKVYTTPSAYHYGGVSSLGSGWAPVSTEDIDLYIAQYQSGAKGKFAVAGQKLLTLGLAADKIVAEGKAHEKFVQSSEASAPSVEEVRQAVAGPESRMKEKLKKWAAKMGGWGKLQSFLTSVREEVQGTGVTTMSAGVSLVGNDPEPKSAAEAGLAYMKNEKDAYIWADGFLTQFSGQEKADAYEELLDLFEAKGYDTDKLEEWKYQDAADGVFGAASLPVVPGGIPHTKVDGGWQADGSGQVYGPGGAKYLTLQYLSGDPVPASELLAYTDGAKTTSLGFLVENGVSEQKALDYLYPPGGMNGPQDGDTKTIGDRTYVLKNGRWHLASGGDEESFSPEPGAQYVDEYGIKYRKTDKGWDFKTPDDQDFHPVISGPSKEKLKAGKGLYGDALVADKPAAKVEDPSPAGNPWSDDEWAQLYLPDTNTNAPSHNKKIDALKAAADAGDLAAIQSMKFGKNTYGKKQAKIAEHLIADMGAGISGAQASSKAPASLPGGWTLSTNDPDWDADAAVLKTKADDGSTVYAVYNTDSGNWIAGSFSEDNEHSVVFSDPEDAVKYINGMAVSHGFTKLPTAALSGLKTPQSVAGGPSVDAPPDGEVKPGSGSASKSPSTDKGWEIDWQDGAFSGSPSLSAVAPDGTTVYAAWVDSDGVYEVGYIVAGGNPKADHFEHAADAYKKLADLAEIGGITAEITPGDLLKLANGPQEGDTKQGADGLLVFKNGRWHKMSEDEATAIFDPTADGWIASVVAGKVPSKEQADAYELLDEDSKLEVMGTALGMVSGDYDADDAEFDKLMDEAAAKIEALHEAALTKAPAEPETKPAASGKAKVPQYQFVYQDGKSHKFWNVHVDGSSLVTSFGKMGTKGQTQVKEFKTHALANAALVAKTKEKKAKGYELVDSASIEVDAPVAAPTQAAPVSPPPVPHKKGEPKKPKSIDGWKEMPGTQKGSNPGGLFTDEHGQNWYVKFPATADHANNEVLGAKLYQMLGLKTPSVRLVKRGGKVGVASKWIDGLSKGSPAELAAAQGTLGGFGADAWLANWDVVGLANDNLLVDSNGNAVRLDSGGSLLFRAQGEAKGGAFGDTVPELESLLDAGKNAQSAAVFKGITKQQKLESIAAVIEIPDDVITLAVKTYGPGNAADKQALADKLIARKNYLAKAYPEAHAIAFPPKPDPRKLPIDKAKLPPPPDFKNWKGSGKGLSGVEKVNDANNAAVQEIYAAAAKGDYVRFKALSYHVVNKETGETTVGGDFANHPSQHVGAYYSSMMDYLEVLANPAANKMKSWNVADFDDLQDLVEAFPAHFYGISVGSVPANQRLGFWISLGQAEGAMGFMPEKVDYVSHADKAKGQASTKSMPQILKSWMKSVKGSGSANQPYRDGKEVDYQGRKTRDVLEAAYAHAVEFEEGTRITKGITFHDTMLKQMVNLPEGHVFQNPGSMCCSLNKDWDWGGDARLKIIYAKGAKALYNIGVGSYDGEGEITTIPGQRFMLLEKNTKHKPPEFTLLMLPPDPTYVANIKPKSKG